jgi:hypothetical protein
VWTKGRCYLDNTKSTVAVAYVTEKVDRIYIHILYNLLLSAMWHIDMKGTLKEHSRGGCVSAVNNMQLERDARLLIYRQTPHWKPLCVSPLKGTVVITGYFVG